MIIDMKGKYGTGLALGTQTNPANVENNMHWKIKAWKPKRAKSYSISHIRETDYHGRTENQVTGYRSFYVTYYTTLMEGAYLIDSELGTEY